MFMISWCEHLKNVVLKVGISGGVYYSAGSETENYAKRPADTIR